MFVKWTVRSGKEQNTIIQGMFYFLLYITGSSNIYEVPECAKKRIHQKIKKYQCFTLIV